MKIASNYGNLTPIGQPFRGEADGRWRVECRCSCGKATSVRVYLLESGKTASCGCLRKAASVRTGHANRKHGHAHGPTWKAYYAMLDRCLKPHHKSFARYGGRGITVCSRWRDSFATFLEDMGERPSGMSIERIHSEGNYEPGNCRWATAKEQANNRSDNRFVDAFGCSLTVAQWADEYGIAPATIQRRLKIGWTTENAVSAPVTDRSSRKRISLAMS